MALLSIYFGFFRNHTTYDEKMEIDLRDTDQISEISITQANNVVKISKVANKWLVDKVYNANEVAIKRLFRIFMNLEIGTLLPEIEHDSIVNHLKQTGIAISFYENKNLLAIYYIGNYDENKKSTLLMTDEELPIYVSAPGLTSDIRKFVEADPVFWRNKRIFQFEPTEISSIIFFDFRKPANSFQIDIQGEDYHLFDQNHQPYQFDKEKVSRYISYFKNIDFESVADGLSSQKADSVIKQSANYMIKVKSSNGQESELKLLPIAIQNQQNQYDLNKAYGIINNRQPIVVINYFAVDPIIKEIDYFKNSISEK